MRRFLFPIAMLAVVASAAACSSASPGSAASPSGAATSPSVAATSPAPSTSATGQAADCGGGTWHTGSVTVTRHVAVPPVPVLADIRTASHAECGYDRVVVDIRGALPGYSIAYVSHVVADPSGKPVTVPGSAVLLVTVRPAQGHTDAGAPTLPGGVHTLGFRMLAGWATAGDFEGVVRLAIGVRSRTAFRVGELPGRLYIDVRF
jgi:hypothetical protein